MKTRKYISLLLGFVTGTAVILLFSSYGNLRNHPAINDEIVNKFNSEYSTISKFKNYIFELSQKNLSGKGAKESVMFYRNYDEIDYNFSPREWIAHGGMSADVPEVQAAVRHFYDPTVMDTSDRYLHDVAFGPIMTFAQEVYPNPHINDLDWAQYGDLLNPGNPYDHVYTWENGKKWMMQAYEASSILNRQFYMAKAWRALGETLHMIADHGCPAHVRDDSHPAPRGMSSLIGNPDPYEEIMAADFKTQIADFASRNPDASLKADLDAAKGLRYIAHKMAIFTNSNFFTNETITGTDKNGNHIFQKAHPDWEYTSPWINELNYNAASFTYRSTVGGQTVFLCSDKSYFWEYAKIGLHRGFPRINKQCVSSQAYALIPAIVVAGVNIMRIFMPDIKIEITSTTGGTISGTVTHQPDPEYPDKKYYNGEVTIEIRDASDNPKFSITCNACNGLFSGTAALNNGDRLVAKINMQGFQVKSDAYVNSGGTSDLSFVQHAKIFIDYDYCEYEEFTSIDTAFMGGDQLYGFAGYMDNTKVYFPGTSGRRYNGIMSGNNFSGSCTGGNGAVTVSGDGKTVVSFTATFSGGYSDGGNFYIEASDVAGGNLSRTLFYTGTRAEFTGTANITSINYQTYCKNRTDQTFQLLNHSKSTLKTVKVVLE